MGSGFVVTTPTSMPGVSRSNFTYAIVPVGGRAARAAVRTQGC